MKLPISQRLLRACPGLSAPAPIEADFDVLALDKRDYARAGITASGPAWEELQTSYADLPADVYLPEGASYRRRRFGRFSFDTETGSLRALADRPFFQAAQVNRLNGGFDRHFAALTPALSRNRVLYQLIRFHAMKLRRVSPEISTWKVYLHQIRIAASAEQSGKPAPEGLHQDGHHYVAQVLVARENVAGAESRVLDLGGRLIACTTLTDALDTLLVNDRSVFHEVTELHCLAADRLAYRDMLLIDFNPYDDADEN
ncbi:MAG TPA: 2OG-Fe dioxygenase family protein [Ramlibacter sp.]|nr:2OG-Fe dioxygenase family protein [Ramlibacter sp.]